MWPILQAKMENSIQSGNHSTVHTVFLLADSTSSESLTRSAAICNCRAIVFQLYNDRMAKKSYEANCKSSAQLDEEDLQKLEEESIHGGEVNVSLSSSSDSPLNSGKHLRQNILCQIASSVIAQ